MNFYFVCSLALCLFLISALSDPKPSAPKSNPPKTSPTGATKQSTPSKPQPQTPETPKSTPGTKPASGSKSTPPTDSKKADHPTQQGQQKKNAAGNKDQEEAFSSLLEQKFSDPNLKADLAKAAASSSTASPQKPAQSSAAPRPPPFTTGSGKDGTVLGITKETFFRATNKTAIILFHRPTCEHCKVARSTWRILSRVYNWEDDKDIPVEYFNNVHYGPLLEKKRTHALFAEVNCGSETDLCGMEEIRHYPTLRLYTHGFSFDFRENMEAKEVQYFVEGGYKEPFLWALFVLCVPLFFVFVFSLIFCVTKSSNTQQSHDESSSAHDVSSQTETETVSEVIPREESKSEAEIKHTDEPSESAPSQLQRKKKTKPRKKKTGQKNEEENEDNSPEHYVQEAEVEPEPEPEQESEWKSVKPKNKKKQNRKPKAE